MASTTYVSGTPIVKEWLNDVNTFVYKSKTVNPLSPAFGAVGDGVADDTAAIHAAIASLPATGGTLLLPGSFKTTGLVVNKPIKLIGLNSGQFYAPSQAPVSKLLYAGAAGGVVLTYSGAGTNIIGGGIEDLMIDGNSLAARGILHKDHQRGYFKGLLITGTTDYGWHMQNSVGCINGFHVGDNIYIQLRNNAATTNASGMFLDGTNTGGADGTTLCNFRRMRVDHVNGAGILISQIGDGFNWDALQTFRINGDTGMGVDFQGTAGAICGYHQFYNPIVSGGFRFLTAGLHAGTRIHNDGQGDVNTSTRRVFGPGAAEVEYTGGYGFSFGRGLIPDPHRMTVRDTMNLIRFDSANNVLHTANGNWKTALVGTGGITDAAQPGGALRLTTGTTNNDSTSIFDTSNVSAGSGWSFNRSVLSSIVYSLITTSNIVVRMGYMNSTGDVVTNGAYMEFDPSVNANWQAVTVSGGVETRTVTSFAGFAGLQEFSIYVAQTGQSVVFQYRNDANTFYGIGATHTTNIPLGGVPFTCRIKTKTGSAASFDVYAVKNGGSDECAPAF